MNGSFFKNECYDVIKLGEKIKELPELEMGKFYNLGEIVDALKKLYSEKCKKIQKLRVRLKSALEDKAGVYDVNILPCFYNDEVNVSFKKSKEASEVYTIIFTSKDGDVYVSKSNTKDKDVHLVLGMVFAEVKGLIKVQEEYFSFVDKLDMYRFLRIENFYSSASVPWSDIVSANLSFKMTDEGPEFLLIYSFVVTNGTVKGYYDFNPDSDKQPCRCYANSGKVCSYILENLILILRKTYCSKGSVPSIVAEAVEANRRTPGVE